MCKLSLCFVLVVNSLNAALITTGVTCDTSGTSGSGDLNCLVGTPSSPDYRYASATAGAYSVMTSADANRYHSASASASFSDEVLFTVTGGLSTGYFVPCLTIEQDSFQGTAMASAQFGASYVATVSQGVGGGCVGPISFTAGISQQFAITLSAKVSVGSNYSNAAQGNASASITGFEFRDASMNRVSGVTYDLTEVIEATGSVPEPPSRSLLIAGVVVFMVALRFTTR